MSDERECKLDRVARKWGLTGLDDDLRERWAAGDSLRELERYYNERVLGAAMETAGMDPLDGEVSNLYRLLTDEAVSAGKRVDARSRLRHNGLDPATLADDFVSYGTVRNHLNECLDVETRRETELGIDEARRRVLKLLSRTESVTDRTVSRLSEAGSVTVTAPSVTVSLRVACSECGDEYTFPELLEREGCSCGSYTGGRKP